MQIGGKEYKVGQRIRIINAKSVLHYRYGMAGDCNEDMTGITGTITAESTYDRYARANLKVDKQYAEHYHNGMTRLFCDDEIEAVEIMILPIKGKWFNMILSGDKQEEYREIKPYYTTRNVLTDTQMDVLEKHSRLGALCGVCICIQDDFFFIPWNVWRDMKEMYGRQYLKSEDIEEYKVKFDGAVHFLMHTEELKGAYENAERKR